MTTTRRTFLGMLGLAPAMAKPAAAAMLPDLIAKLGTSTTELVQAGMGRAYSESIIADRDFINIWKSDALGAVSDELINQFFDELDEVIIRKRRRRTCSVEALDPNIACLRSVSLSTKVRMQMADDDELDALRNGAYLKFRPDS